jgi:uncharacterized protein YceH (UPF0502 family)
MIPGVMLLDAVEVRVLSSLVEKESTTPEYYPLSLNALVNACNQKSNRDPLMNLDEDSVRRGLRTLAEKGLAGPADTTDSRVTKYEHHLGETFNFDRREIAILCVLLLRGPQTPGELRGRAERMHKFEDLSEVQSTLHKLMNRERPLVRVLPRQPGTKEARYVHLLSGDEESGEQPEQGAAHASSSASDSAPTPQNSGRVEQLEAEVAALRREVADLRQQLHDFRKQFQ